MLDFLIMSQITQVNDVSNLHLPSACRLKTWPALFVNRRALPSALSELFTGAKGSAASTHTVGTKMCDDRSAARCLQNCPKILFFMSNKLAT